MLVSTSRKAHQYAHSGRGHGEEHVVILARVLMGDACLCKEPCNGKRLAPSRNQDTGNFYFACALS